MRIEDKYSRFQSGSLTAERILTRQDLAAIDVRGIKGLQDVLFERGASIDSSFLAPGKDSFVGAYSYMNDGGYIRGRCFIGRYSSIGRRVTIGAGRHWISGLSTNPSLSGGPPERNYTAAEMALIGVSASGKASATCIGCDVWIGDGAIIMPGVSIGHGAIIGANAVVTTDVPPYAIVVGLPGRVLRYRFEAAQVQDLLASRWWDHPRETLQSLPLGNILKALEGLRALSPPDDPYETFRLAVPSQ
ncbi:CatB-related O-acetyltransferase [Gemmobacter serpentinus]|uniref:CatB-related O-acetyltransferase n=1 Tax=Gemmobacter serpentinus TaxID=2652247 RepID=UPI00299DDA68|nr:CatB-related O-acetyltransferase [Gemmobacter serpentinus]